MWVLSDTQQNVQIRLCGHALSLIPEASGIFKLGERQSSCELWRARNSPNWQMAIPHEGRHLTHSTLPHNMTVMSAPEGSPSRGGEVMVYVTDINSPSSPTPFYSVLVFVSAFMALSTLFHSINSPDNSSLSHSVLLVLILPYWSFQLYISLWKSLSALM